jgi:hypothetical protein
MIFKKGNTLGFQKGNTLGKIHKGRDAFWMRGKKMSESTKEKLRLINTGRKISEEQKEKLRRANTGKKHSEETRRKMRASQQKVTQEGRRKGWNVRMFGAENPQWKGGVTPLYRIIRKSKEYDLWRTAVFIRDNRTCIWCGSKDKIEADHIKPFSLFPELRFAIDNGRTLCHDCHRKTETYGNRKNAGFRKVSI